MRRMIDKYADQATKTGARIVHSCGFDSVPSDMGVFFTQQQAFEKFDQYLSSIQYHLMETKGGVSGGTIASLLNVVKEAMRDKSIGKLLVNPYSLNPDPSFKGVDGREQSKVIYSDDLQTWTTPFVMASINTRIVRRTNALLDFIYGENFSYNETMVTGSGSKGYVTAKIASAVNKSITFLGISKFGRKILGGILPAQGEGPEIDPDNPGFYKILFLGKTDAGELIQSQLCFMVAPQLIIKKLKTDTIWMSILLIFYSIMALSFSLQVLEERNGLEIPIESQV